MENVFIISDNEIWVKKIIEGIKPTININKIDFDNSLSNDEDFDFWIKKNIDFKTKVLLIPIELGTNNQISIIGLKFAIHLRLLPKSDLRRLLPIIFISNKNENDIRLIQRKNFDLNHFDYIIGTDATDFVKPIIEELIAIINYIQPLTEINYKKCFYDNIKILPAENTGNHAIANIWGAYRLAQITGNKDLLLENISFKKESSSLYFKYLTAFNQNNEANFIKKIIKNASNKKILLIDDEARKGWSNILKAIFDKSNFEYVEPEPKADFIERATKKALEKEAGLPKWDLILLDLRLIDTEDFGNKANKNIEKYSGAELLKKIKDDNKGTQVIMFTASNKAWNIQKLLEMGANGFYIKESPEQNYESGFSIQNFENFESQVQKCFEMKDLKDIYLKTSNLDNTKLKQNKCDTDKLKELKLTITTNINTAFDLLSNSNSIEFAFLNYIVALEDYCKFFAFYDTNNKKAIAYSTLSNLNNRKNEIIVFEIDPSDNTKFKSKYKYEKGFYDFQNKKNQDNDKQFIKYSKEDCVYEEKKLTYSIALKLVALLDIQLNDISDIEKLMELIFIRNSGIAHSGNFDKSKRPITISDVYFLFCTINKFLNKTF